MRQKKDDMIDDNVRRFFPRIPERLKKWVENSRLLRYAVARSRIKRCTYMFRAKEWDAIIAVSLMSPSGSLEWSNICPTEDLVDDIIYSSLPHGLTRATETERRKDQKERKNEYTVRENIRRKERYAIGLEQTMKEGRREKKLEGSCREVAAAITYEIWCK